MKIIKRSLATIVMTVFGLAVGFLVQIVLAKYVEPKIFGNFVTILAVAGVVSLFPTIGLGNALPRFIPAFIFAKDDSKFADYFCTSLALFAGFIILAFLAVYIFNVNHFLIYVVLVSAGMSFFSYSNSLLKALKKPVHATLFEPSLKHLVFLIVVGAVLFIHKNILLYNIVILFTGTLFSLGILQFFIASNYLPSIKMREGRLRNKQWLVTGLHLSLMSSAFLFFINIDIYMIRYFLGAENVAIYFVAQKLASLMLIGLGAARMVISPYVSEHFQTGDIGEIKQVLSQGIAVAVTLSLFVLFGILVACTAIFDFLGGDYPQAYVPTLILSFGLIIVVSFSLAETLLIMTGHERIVLLTYAISIMSVVALNYLFIVVYEWGINGGALATAISLILHNIINIRHLSKQLNISIYESILDSLSLIKTLPSLLQPKYIVSDSKATHKK